MADPFDAIDPGQDFEAFAVGLAPVTVERVDPDTGEPIATATGVPATKLVRRRAPWSAGAGALPGDAVEFVFRSDRLGFLPKSPDRITDAGGTVWNIESAALEGFDALCRAQVSIRR